MWRYKPDDWSDFNAFTNIFCGVMVGQNVKDKTETHWNCFQFDHQNKNQLNSHFVQIWTRLIRNKSWGMDVHVNRSHLFLWKKRRRQSALVSVVVGGIWSVCMCVWRSMCICRCVYVPRSSLCLFDGLSLCCHSVSHAHAPTQTKTHISTHKLAGFTISYCMWHFLLGILPLCLKLSPSQT